MTASEPTTSSPVETFLDWLIAMDDPSSAAGMSARQTVTLTRIIEHARDTRRWVDLVKTTDPELLGYPADVGPHLWQVDHPYYGADGYINHEDSFGALKAMVESMDEDMNLVYRWDWKDYREPQHDGLFLEGEFRDKQELTVFWLMPRKEKCGSVTCPVTHDQETEVREWLSGPRCLGHLRKVWAPLMGGAA